MQVYFENQSGPGVIEVYIAGPNEMIDAVPVTVSDNIAFSTRVHAVNERLYAQMVVRVVSSDSFYTYTPSQYPMGYSGGSGMPDRSKGVDLLLVLLSIPVGVAGLLTWVKSTPACIALLILATVMGLGGFALETILEHSIGYWARMILKFIMVICFLVAGWGVLAQIQGDLDPYADDILFVTLATGAAGILSVVILIKSSRS